MRWEREGGSGLPKETGGPDLRGPVIHGLTARQDMSHQGVRGWGCLSTYRGGGDSL